MTMPEYIEREDTLRQMRNSKADKPPYGNWDIAHDCCIDIAKNIPTADVVEVKHGYWINTAPYRAVNGNYNKAQECSVCLAYFVSDGNTPYSNHPYCCKCGAKMDLKEGAEE